MFVWNTADGTRVWQNSGKGKSIRSVAMLPDGKGVLTGEAGGRVALWRLDDGGVTAELVGHKKNVNSVAVSRTTHFACQPNKNGNTPLERGRQLRSR